MSQKVFFHLALDGRIGRGRPRGTWVGSQVRWSPIERWLPDGIAEMPVMEAQAELVRRWLRSFGPGTLEDIKWWTGWSITTTKQALTATGAVEVDLEDVGTGYLLPDDLESSPGPEPWIALLPALDRATIGWKERDWYLGGYRSELFDTAGNGGPTIWVDDGSSVVGGSARPGRSPSISSKTSAGRRAGDRTGGGAAGGLDRPCPDRMELPDTA